MNWNRSLSLLVGVSLVALACSKEKETKTVSVGGKGTAIDPNDGSATEVLTKLVSVAGSDPAKAFLQPMDFKWAISENSLMLNRADGATLVYNRAAADWGHVEISDHASSYASLFAYPDGSFSGLNPGVLSLRKGTQKLLSIDTTKIMPDGSTVLGVTPGFFAAAVTDGILVVQGEGTSVKATKLKSSPAALLEVGACASGCMLWGYDGEAIYTFGSTDIWTKHTIPFSLPEGKKVARLALNLSLDAKSAVKITDAALMTEDGLLFVSTFGASADQPITFEQVKRLVTAYCVSCHSGDAFEFETGLKSRKSEVIKRLNLAPENALAMPPKSAPKPISTTDKKVIISWLTLQTEGVDTAPVITNPGTGTDTNATTPVTGAIATQSEKYCLSCHPTAKFKEFWITEKGNITSRVTSGNMPVGKTMSADEKAALLNALNVLN